MTNSNLYQGNLFDGKSSVPLPVSVVVYPDRLVVHLQNQEGIAQTQTWETAKLKEYQKLAQDFVQIRYGEFPSQTLEIKSVGFAESFKPPVSGVEKFTHQIVHGGWVSLFSISAVVLGLLLIAYFFLLPWLAEKSVDFVPKEYEVQMGNGLFKNLVKEEDIDVERSKIANQFLKQMDFQTDYPLHVTVVNSPIKNAFALPGGQVVVYTQLLDEMKSYEELAGLLGHEVGHVKHRHTTKNIFRSFSGYLLISVFLGDFSGVTATILDNANQLHQLSYSRSLETEADLSGFETLKHNHINPNGMISLFENLQKGSVGALFIPEILSTHPETGDRMNFIKAKIKKERPSYSTHEFLEGLFHQLQQEK